MLGYFAEDAYLNLPSYHGFQVRQQYSRANLIAKNMSLLHFSMQSSQTVGLNFQFPLCSNLHEGASVVLAPKLSIPS